LRAAFRCLSARWYRRQMSRRTRFTGAPGQESTATFRRSWVRACISGCSACTGAPRQAFLAFVRSGAGPGPGPPVVSMSCPDCRPWPTTPGRDVVSDGGPRSETKERPCQHASARASCLAASIRPCCWSRMCEGSRLRSSGNRGFPAARWSSSGGGVWLEPHRHDDKLRVFAQGLGRQPLHIIQRDFDLCRLTADSARAGSSR
jgi:hypothetical protein